jgi:hypothetical protein
MISTHLTKVFGHGFCTFSNITGVGWVCTDTWNAQKVEQFVEETIVVFLDVLID